MKHAKDEVKMEEADSPARLTAMPEDGSQGSEGKADASERASLAEITDQSLLKQRVLELIDFYLEQFGGPVQFLLHQFDTTDAQDQFRKELLALCPWMDCVERRRPLCTSPC